MNDRLGDLPSWANDDDDSSAGDIEMGGGNNQQQMQSKMDHFFSEVETIKRNIEGVQKATKTIASINDKALQATTTQQEQQLSKQLRPTIDTTNAQAKQTKTMLGLLKEETKKLEGDLKASDIRLRDNLLNTLTRKFIDEMKEYQKAQQKYKTDIQNKVKRQVRTVKPDATDEEVDEVLRSEGGRDALYRKQILAGGVNDQIKTTYAKVAGKYQDVLALESSVAELHQMFLDFALLTEQQGELLDQIEYNVKQAADHVEDANVDVYESIEYQRKIRKKQCWILLIVAGVMAVLVFFLFR